MLEKGKKVALLIVKTILPISAKIYDIIDALLKVVEGSKYDESLKKRYKKC